MNNIQKAEEYEKDSMNAIITPTSSEDELDKKWQDYNNMHRKKQREADWKAQELYGKTNEELYNEYKAKFMKKDSQSNEYDNETIDFSTVGEQVEAHTNYHQISYPIEAVDKARQWAADANRSIVYPTSDEVDLDMLYNNFNSMIRKNQRESDWKSLELFGVDNKTHYEFLKSKFLKKDSANDKDDPLDLHNDITHDDEALVSSVNTLSESMFLPDTMVTPHDLLPYYSPDEIEYLKPNDNDYLQLIDKLDIPEFSFNEWMKQYKEYYNGVRENYNPYAWKRVVQRLSNYVEQSRDLGIDTHVEESALLALGWNPSIPFNESTMGAGAIRYASKYNTYEIISIEENTVLDEAFKIKEALEPIYIVLVQGHSIFSKTIMAVTNGPFSHAAISMDSSLENLYSYNIQNTDHPGLSFESIKKYGKDSFMGVFAIFVKDEDKKNIKERLEYFVANRDKTRYSFINIATFAAGVPLERQFSMICSQFVDSVLKSVNIDITGKNSSLVSPNDFMFKATSNKKIYKLYQGKCGEYKQGAIDNKIAKIFSKGSARYIKEAKEFPVYFDDAGNLFIKNFKKKDINDEYNKSHKLLIQYEKSNNIEGIKYELCKMFYLYQIAEDEIQNHRKNNLSDKEYKYYVDAKARINNDLTKYLKIVNDNEKDFNFRKYYEDSPYGSTHYKIRASSIKYTIKGFKDIII